MTDGRAGRRASRHREYGDDDDDDYDDDDDDCDITKRRRCSTG